MALNSLNIMDGLCQTIGRTPLIPLKQLFSDAPYQVYAKLEMMNPGGSAKDRPALNIVREAIRTGEIDHDTTVIESSSGNMAVSLAQICRYLGLRFVCVVDPRTTDTHLKLIRSLHGEIEMVTEPDPGSGDYLPARIARVKKLQQEIKSCYWTNQYSNPNNYLAHYHSTMPEILEVLPHIDYLFCGVSSCGTVRGCAERLKLNNLPTQIIAVDAVGSVIFGGVKGVRQFPGLGAALPPPINRTELVDRVIEVSERQCIEGCLELVQSEAIMAGASSGGVIAAIRAMQDEIPAGAICVAILPDRGERYLDTVYNEEWVRQHVGSE
ncbi:2,3-diaminopropionate biosynthesis protein SbnA [Cohnella sp. WQ 127256]|uniref:2,3-diaminopropionate biosynthesis protein SbnA n=1 Tax=Cohnella sp. WQ 127256 TaxID=2938790 RepID=UPI00211865D0|nr:2,3-diaminopropionate biosynthesis protein SbnA [Cohnella sp. WQ 127256]